MLAQPVGTLLGTRPSFSVSPTIQHAVFLPLTAISPRQSAPDPCVRCVPATKASLVHHHRSQRPGRATSSTTSSDEVFSTFDGDLPASVRVRSPRAVRARDGSVADERSTMPVLANVLLRATSEGHVVCSTTTVRSDARSSHVGQATSSAMSSDDGREVRAACKKLSTQR